MPFAAFLLEAVAISLSGVMAPGPVTSVVVGKGSESPHAGALVALGHGVVEFPLMIAVFYGVGHLLATPHTRAAVALAGGLFLLWMGVDMLRSLRRQVKVEAASGQPPFVAGILLSAGNPYFLVWWATVGAALIVRSEQFGWGGFLAFALAHWACDFVWDYGLSALSFKGGQVLGARFQKGVLLLCSVALIIFGGRFVWDGATRIGVAARRHGACPSVPDRRRSSPQPWHPPSAYRQFTLSGAGHTSGRTPYKWQRASENDGVT